MNWNGNGATLTLSYPISFSEKTLIAILSDTIGIITHDSTEGAAITSYTNTDITIKTDWTSGYRTDITAIFSIGF